MQMYVADALQLFSRHNTKVATGDTLPHILEWCGVNVCMMQITYLVPLINEMEPELYHHPIGKVVGEATRARHVLREWKRCGVQVVALCMTVE